MKTLAQHAQHAQHTLLAAQAIVLHGDLRARFPRVYPMQWGLSL